jgi:hypothetical protein
VEPGRGEGGFWRDFHRSGNWPLGNLSLVRGADGRYWLFWHLRAGSGASPDQIRELRPTKLAEGDIRGARNPHVTVDAQGTMHMVSDGFGRAIHYRTSSDGETWSRSLRLVDLAQGRTPRHPQLVLDRERAALIYQDSKSCWWLARGRLEPEVRFEEPIQITNWLSGLSGSRLCVTPDGGLAVMAGRESVWLLRADASRLARPRLGEF